MKFDDLRKYRVHKDEPEDNICLRLLTEFLDEQYPTEKDKSTRITISPYHLAKHPPIELRMFDNLLDDFDETYQKLKSTVHEWSGTEREIAFEVTNAIVPELLNNQINHHWENKLVKIVGMVDVVGHWQSYPRLRQFTCHQCGTINNSPYKSTKCTACTATIRRPSKIFYTSRKTVQLNQKDVANSVPCPCFYEIPTDKLDDPLFRDSQVMGNQVEILAVPRPIKAGSQYNLDDVEWHLQIFGIKRRKFRNISKDRANHIIKKIKDDPNSFNKIAESMAYKTYGHKYLKRFTLASCVGLNKDDKEIEGKNPAFNGLVVGDPSLGKSFTIKQIMSYFPITQYAQGSSTTTVGLLGGVDKAKGGNFIMRAGAVQQCDGGVLVLDELDKMPIEQTRGLFTALSEGHHTITKVTGTHEFKYNTCFICIANPKHSRFEPDVALYSQIDLKADYLSRMLWVVIVKKPYLDENGNIDQEKHKVHRAYVSQRICYHKNYDDDFLRDYAVLVKKIPNAKLGDNIKIKCENYFAEKNAIFESKKAEDFKEAQVDTSTKQMDERTLNAMMHLCKIIGKATFHTKVQDYHFEIAKDMYDNGMLTDLIGTKASSLTEFQAILEDAKTEKAITSSADKMWHIEHNVPKEPTDEEEVVVMLEKKLKLNRIEIEKYIAVLVRGGNLFQPRSGMIMRAGG